MAVAWISAWLSRTCSLKTIDSYENGINVIQGAIAESGNAIRYGLHSSCQVVIGVMEDVVKHNPNASIRSDGAHRGNLFAVHVFWHPKHVEKVGRRVQRKLTSQVLYVEADPHRSQHRWSSAKDTLT